MRQKILRKLFPSFLLITAVSVAGVTAVFSSFLKSAFLKETYASLAVHQATVHNDFTNQKTPMADLCRNFRGVGDLKVSVLLPTGERVCDSNEKVTESERSATLEVGSSRFFNPRLGGHEVFLTDVLRGASGDVLAFVRVSKPEAVMVSHIRSLFLKVGLACLLVFGFAGLVGFVFSKRLTFPLTEMRKGALAYADGNFKQPIFVPEIEELASLSIAMNKMARELTEKIETETRQRSEKEIILASMAEAVMAIDPNQRIISANAYALKLFNTSSEMAIGRPMQETIRNAALEKFVEETFSRSPSDEEILEGEIALPLGHKERLLQVHGTLMRGSDQTILGVLIVLNDVTHLRQLETIRKEFVANVSHELKTPITSIKGFVETLLDGAYQDPADAKRFLEIVAKHADRLNLIIEDLLSLSRIEKEGDNIDLERTQLKRILQSALLSCDSKLKNKNMRISMDCPEQLFAKINPSLFEQAIVNLIDNAIKYSDPDKTVSIEAKPINHHLEISVRDEGVGIATEHLPRLFERFYRVDKSRSRNLGGTGLGLSIVKHIAQAHQGSVGVESTLGQGSTFKINIPAIE